MEFSTKSVTPEKQKCACLVVGVFAGKTLGTIATRLDEASAGTLAKLIARGDLDAKAGATLMLHHLPGVLAERVLLVSYGKEDEFNEKAYRSALTAAAKALASLKAGDAVVTLADVELKGRDAKWLAAQATQILRDTAYKYDAPRAKKDDDKRGASKITLAFAAKPSAETTRGAAQGSAIAAGMALARDLGNLPGNVCTPTHLADTAKKLAKEFKSIKVETFDNAGIEKLGMGSFLSVTKGSHEPARFIVMQYHGAKSKKAKPIVLVGKGLTFDSGGISLKPGEGMDEMKYDMCGGASVLGTFRALAELELPINVVGLIPSTENMPGGSAVKPGDVVTSMSGQTIEILNTDAEGRLILCDALTYAERFEPECVIDIATLTGACVIALGNHTTGLLANDDELARELLDVGVAAGDRAWQLPLFDEYQEQLKSNFADMANIGGRAGGTITAACFLSRFTKAYKWAHLDIAGTAWKSGADKGSTGRPVPLLTQFLIKRAGA
ncbi:leucyl aminopeptidase [Niveibacterium microcysteis]|uniref:Probable cytosol aminopeptidase n=1 Tax=Niveibacterium microcysteis TaxID=2811415 RepID=A0ABX7MB11_9RHOO|nr:leucyl aminopeptidase [Niveibacterium microcysteis]QSI78333.1 leucyl aminopeptidase [Niveibacterium microcysteis]